MPRLLIILCCYLIFFSQCKNDQNQSPDVSTIELNGDVIRFDQALSHLDTTQIVQSLLEFWPKHQRFNDIYFKNILGINSDSIPIIAEITKNLITHSTNQYIQQIVDSIYPGLEVFEPLKQSLKLLKHYLPGWKDPNIYTFISEFGLANFIFNDGERDGLGVGLDFFLGNRIPYKQIDPSNPSFSEYLARTFNKEHLTTKALRTILDDIVKAPTQNQILDPMIHEGKILYAISKLVPDTPDSIIHEYTDRQMLWCEENEYEIWAFLIEENILYSNDFRKYNKLINPSPTSPGMPKESPGRTANYCGFQIVSAYMDQTKVPWHTLFETDAKTILSKSKYKPKRKA